MIAVIGETPYAEGNGDIGKRSLDNALLHPEDLAVLDRVSGKGAPVATVLLSGRPLYVNKELNRSDAFVAAWLPGTEGQGVADLLVRGRHKSHGFSGTLSYSWPATPCQTPLNAGDEDYAPLFKLGYGLRSGQRSHIGQLTEETVARCVDSGGGGTTDEELEIFVRQDVAPYKSYIGSPDNWGGTELGNDPSAVIAHTNIEARTSDVNVQQDARKITWKGGAGQFYLQGARGGSAPVPQQQRRDRVRHDRDQGADGPDGDQRALHVPVLLGRPDPEGVHEDRGRREAHGQDPAVVPGHGLARVRPHQHAVPHLHRGGVGGGLRQRPVGPGRGRRRGRGPVL